MVNQLNQDLRADSIADSGHGMAVMEGSEVDVAGDEEVEGRDKGVTAEAAVETGVANLGWDPWDPLFEFNDKNSSITQTPIAALTPVLMPAENDMPDLKGSDPEEPPSERPQVESLLVDNPKATSMRELIPDYSDIPLVGFSQPELYQVVPWICFEAQNMCESPGTWSWP